MSAEVVSERYQADTGEMPEVAPLPYDTIYDRVETITRLILDGSLLPEDGVLLAVSVSEPVVAAERLRREGEARVMRRRYSAEAKARAVALVAGGASCRMAAVAVLGEERHHVNVWRWARQAGVR